MTPKPVYRYKREDGKTVDSLTKPNCEYTERVRLVAEKGKLLTKDGENFCRVIDVDTDNGWYEVNAPEETEDEQ